MNISDQDMAHLKLLARLELSQEETERLKGDLSAILGYFEQLKDLDTEGAEELARPIHTENVFREDAVLPPLSHETVMALAVEAEGGFFKVPRTVDADG